MKQILVDSSVWIAFFRGTDQGLSGELAGLLRSGAVVTAGPVVAELLSGIRKPADRTLVEGCLKALPRIDPEEDPWTATGNARGELGKRGVRASLVDVWIALAARDHEAALWTLDEDFEGIRKVVPFERR